MKTIFAVFGIILQLYGATHSLIVPDEVPTLLSVIYSNIPVIKKGTDSRVGWGFRLGDRADFQVLVELGPQTNTQPLANQDSSSSASKRNVQNNLRNTLYAQQKNRKKYVSNTDGGKWLSEWSSSMQNTQGAKYSGVPTGAEPVLGIGEVDAKSVIPDDSTLALAELYKRNVKRQNIRSTTQKPSSTTSAKDALDNVDMDGE